MILVVDDYEDSRDAMCRLFTARGYPCQTASDGLEAIAFIRSHPPEQPLLVVMDAMMPNMSGIEALRQIRTDPKIEHTPVIIFSAGFNVALRDEAITLRASAWILKGTDAGFDEICQWYERVGGVKSSTNKPAQSD